MKHLFCFCFLLVALFSSNGFAQLSQQIQGDSWKEVQKNKKGTISVVWDGIDPFIFRAKNGQLMGVEYEVMESFARYVRHKYDIDLSINWVDAQGFQNIIPFMRNTTRKGVFGMAYFSITDERKQFVKFTPPYMPDLNVLVTNNNLPNYLSERLFADDIKRLNAYTMANTSMSQDLQVLQQRFYPPLYINASLRDDYEVLEKISHDNQAFGYLPLAIYIVGLQKGIKVKRQPVLTIKRPGFAAVYPLHSDWDEPVNEFFNSIESKLLTEKIIRTYLGNQMADLVLEITTPDSLNKGQSDLELLRLEKEIVTQRLLDSGVEVENQKLLRNLSFVGAALILLLSIFLFVRHRTTQRLTKQLVIQNDIISHQKQAIEQVNNQLEMKVLQAQMSPHFMANSLRAVQELVKQGQGPKALEYVNGLELFSEMLLQNAENPTTPVANEIKLLNQYLSLEKIRSTDAFDFNIMSDDSPEILQASLPSFIIRPFVEKALEQVIATENKGFLHLQFTRRGNQLVVKLQHSGNTSPLIDELLQTRLNVLKRQGKTVEINTLPLKSLQGHSTGIQQEIILPLDWQV